jgi:hypothetical protein
MASPGQAVATCTFRHLRYPPSTRTRAAFRVRARTFGDHLRDRRRGGVWPKLPARADDEPPSEDRRRVAPNTEGAGVTVVVNPQSGSGVDEELATVAYVRLRGPKVPSLRLR